MARRLGGAAMARQPLRCPDVGCPVHADVAVRPGLAAAPLDGIVTIGDLLQEWAEVAVGAVAAAAILDDRVALADGAEGVGLDQRQPARLLVVGRPLQQHRIATLGGRPVDVGHEDGAIPHRHRHVPIDPDAERLARLPLHEP